MSNVNLENAADDLVRALAQLELDNGQEFRNTETGAQTIGVRLDAGKRDAVIRAWRALETVRRNQKDLPPRAEAAPRGTPVEVAVAEAAYREGLMDARNRCLELGRDMGEHPEWARTCADGISELLAAPRAPEPEAGDVTIPRDLARTAYGLLRERAVGHTFDCPCTSCGELRTLHKALGHTPTPARKVERHLPSCGWVQVPGGQVAQTGECRCPPRASEDGEMTRLTEEFVRAALALRGHVSDPEHSCKPEWSKVIEFDRAFLAMRAAEPEMSKAEAQRLYDEAAPTARPFTVTEVARLVQAAKSPAPPSSAVKETPAPSDVSADEVERVAKALAKIYYEDFYTSGRMGREPFDWTKPSDELRETYRKLARYALSLRSAAAKVPSVEELEKVYLDAHFRTPKGYIDSDDKSHRAGIAAVRALFVGGVQ